MDHFLPISKARNGMSRDQAGRNRKKDPQPLCLHASKHHVVYLNTENREEQTYWKKGDNIRRQNSPSSTPSFCAHFVGSPCVVWETKRRRKGWKKRNRKFLGLLSIFGPLLSVFGPSLRKTCDFFSAVLRNLPNLIAVSVKTETKQRTNMTTRTRCLPQDFPM